MKIFFVISQHGWTNERECGAIVKSWRGAEEEIKKGDSPAARRVGGVAFHPRGALVRFA